MTENIGYKQKHKNLDSMPDMKKFSLEDLIKNYGLLTRETWKKSLDRISLKNKIYINLALRKKEDINSPRVKISTVHGAKGSECDNVIMFTDLTGCGNLQLPLLSPTRKLFFIMGLQFVLQQ